MAIGVLSGGAAQGLVHEVRPSFTSATGSRIKGTFGAVGAMKARLLAGEPADVVILTRALIDELARAGHVVAASAKDLGTVETALAVRSGDPKPAVGDRASLRTALLSADAVHVPDPEQSTAGLHFVKVLRALGIQRELASRLRTAPDGAIAMRALASSGAVQPIGCTQTTEIIATAGIDLVAPLPPGCGLATVYTAAVATKASSSVANRLVALLSRESTRAARMRLGFI